MNTNSISLLSDFYEFRMVKGYVRSGLHEKEAHFDLFFRKIPDGGGYAVFAGLEQVCEFVENLKYTEDDIDFLREIGLDTPELARYLKGFKFSGSIYSVPEGSVVFPNEPVLRVKAPLAEAQLIETQLLFLINHQSLIATKASRMANAAGGVPIVEMGARRAHGADAALYGARAAYIGGTSATTCTLASKLFGIPLMGTMAHSWVLTHENEYEAFRNYIEANPESAVLLLDTYDTLSSGTENAVRALSDATLKQSLSAAVRIDSGDIGYLSSKIRQRLDRAGLGECKIIASNSLNEQRIKSLVDEGAPIDYFGVGENLITSESSPVFGGVYKLAALEENGVIVPKIKLSENYSKVTVPGVKKIHRFYDKRTGKAIVDEICLEHERIPHEKHTVFDPSVTWKAKTLTNFDVREMLVPVIENGRRVGVNPSVKEIKKYCKSELDTLCEGVKRLDDPEKYYVDLSEELWTLKRRMTGARRSGFFLR